MTEIQPFTPYAVDVRFPYPDCEGIIQMTTERPRPDSPYTAGLVLDERPLDQPIPFGNFENSYELGNRAVGFTVSRIREAYHIPEPASFYGEIISQLLGALLVETRECGALLGYYYFMLEEGIMSRTGGGLHYDGVTNEPQDAKALVSNVLPTLYVLRKQSDPIETNVGSTEVNYSKVDSRRLWCADTKEITVHQGLTQHGRPACPHNPNAVRRLASLAPARESTDTTEQTTMMIDDQFFPYKEAAKLLRLGDAA